MVVQSSAKKVAHAGLKELKCNSIKILCKIFVGYLSKNTQ